MNRARCGCAPTGGGDRYHPHPDRRLPAAIALTIVMGVCVTPALSPSSAAAQPDPRPPALGTAEGPVEIAVVGNAADMHRIRSLMEPRALTRGGTRWTRVGKFDPMDILRSERDAHATMLRCWVDVLDPKRARLYFAARSGQRFLVRDVELSGTFDEVDRESLSQVLELSISALLENERAGLTRAQTETLLANREQGLDRPERRAAGQRAAGSSAPAVASTTPAPPPAVVAAGAATSSASPSAPSQQQPPPPPPPPPPTSTVPITVVQSRSPSPVRSMQWSGSAFYGAQALGPGLPLAHGPGLGLAMAAAVAGERAALGVWISCQYQLPQVKSEASIGMRFETIAPRAGLELRLPFSVHHLNARVGIGTNVVRLSPQAGTIDPSAMLTAARWSQSVVFSVAVGIRWSLGRNLLLGVAASADALPTVVHYDLRTAGGATSEVFSPWRLRPGLLVEVAIR